MTEKQMYAKEIASFWGFRLEVQVIEIIQLEVGRYGFYKYQFYDIDFLVAEGEAQNGIQETLVAASLIAEILEDLLHGDKPRTSQYIEWHKTRRREYLTLFVYKLSVALSSLRRFWQEYPDNFSRNATFEDIMNVMTQEMNNTSIGDVTCSYNALSSRLRCTVNPVGPCKGCPHYTN